VDLEDNASALTAERSAAAQLRLGWINEPMNASSVPNDNEVSQILQMMRDPSRQPILIHCHFGEDRTGLIVGLYRVLVQRWPAAQAYKEMLDMGFHPKYTALDNYFRQKTGYHGP
jgi:protein tyrosine/serine phosphatase